MRYPEQSSDKETSINDVRRSLIIFDPPPISHVRPLPITLPKLEVINESSLLGIHNLHTLSALLYLEEQNRYLIYEQPNPHYSSHLITKSISCNAELRNMCSTKFNNF